jgi:hypothetical protein
MHIRIMCLVYHAFENQHVMAIIIMHGNQCVFKISLLSCGWHFERDSLAKVVAFHTHRRGVDEVHRLVVTQA